MNVFRKLVLSVALLLFAAASMALGIKPYSASEFADAQQSGSPVALHFHADWCPTCRAQQQVIFDLRKQGGRDMVIYVAKYDDELALRKKYKVMTQSTLIVFKGRTETGRIAGVTDPAGIAGVLDSAK